MVGRCDGVAVLILDGLKNRRFGGMLGGLAGAVLLVEGVEAGAHEGGHGGSLAVVDGTVGDGESYLIEIMEDAIVVLRPDEADEGPDTGAVGEGGDVLVGALDMSAAKFVLGAEVAIVPGGHGAAVAVDAEVAAAVFFPGKGLGGVGHWVSFGRQLRGGDFHPGGHKAQTDQKEKARRSEPGWKTFSIFRIAG